MITTTFDALQLLPTLEKFISPSQINEIKAGFYSSDSQHFFKIAERLCANFHDIPGLPKQYNLRLDTEAIFRYKKFDVDHYIVCGGYINEIFMIGIVTLMPDGYFDEGYISTISINEFMVLNFEIDFNFKPKKLSEMRGV